MAKESKPRIVADVRHIPMKDNVGKMPGWCGRRNHLIQPTSIVADEARTALSTIKAVIISWAGRIPPAQYRYWGGVPDGGILVPDL